MYCCVLYFYLTFALVKLSSQLLLHSYVQSLVNLPVYTGLRHKRVRGKRYDQLIDEFLRAVTRRYYDLLMCRYTIKHYPNKRTNQNVVISLKPLIKDKSFTPG